MKKNDVVIKVNPTNRQVYFNDNFLGLNAENLQSNLVFEFDGDFVAGTPRIEIEKGENKYIITDVSRVDDTYVMEIKSSLLTTDVIWFQLVITEVGNEEIPIFKSKKFYLTVAESINANTELPDEYATLYDQIEEKIAEVNNLNITAERVSDGVEIDITDKTGETTTTKVNDGQDGVDGKDAKINGYNTITIEAGTNIGLEQEGETLTINNIYDDSDKGASIDVSINTTTYVMTINLKNSDGTTISTSSIDLPLESVVVSGYYDSTNKKIVLILKDESTIDIPVGDLVAGLQTEITSDNKLSADLVDDTNSTNKFVTSAEKTTWNNKSDFSGNYNDLTNKPNLTLKEDKSNKVTEIDEDSTDTEYPSAKCVYDSQTKQDTLIDMSFEALTDITDEDTSITLNGTTKAPMEIELSPSELEQDSTNGYQLINLSDATAIASRGVTATINNDDTITFTGTATEGGFAGYLEFNNEIPLINGDSYTWKVEFTGNGIIALIANDWSTIGTRIESTGQTTKTITGTGVGIKRITYVASANEVVNCTIKIMIEKGTTAHDWEKYTGGQSSPSPEYPQNIHVVTGNNTVKIEGKNLLPLTNQDFTHKGMRFYVKNGVLYFDGTATSTISTTDDEFKNQFSFTLQAGSYRFTRGEDGDALPAPCYLRKSSDKSEIGVNNFTFTLSETTEVFFGFYYASGTSFSNATAHMQLALGTGSITDFTPYESQTYPINLGTMELCKIGDYQDYIYKENNKWYKYRAIGKVVLDGSENSWSAESQRYILENVIQGKTFSSLDANTPLAYCNGFKWGNGVSGNYVYGAFWYTANGKNLSFQKDQNPNATTLANFKTWLGSNNQNVYYCLATPVITEITDTTLIGQLNAIKEAYSYKNQTNITQTNNDLPFILKVDAKKLVPSKTSELVNDSGYVKDTDYATSSKGGVIKVNGYGLQVSNGTLIGLGRTYEEYNNGANQLLIAKGTLENVITGKELLATSDVKNNIVSTDEDKPLSANMGKELNDRIQNLASIGKYLAMWDCTTGLPTTNPVTMPYTYTTGDYYVIGNVDSTNYMPNGSSYSGTASSTQYSGTETLNIGDFFYYDGTVWTMLKNTGKTVYFANIAGNPTDNSNLASALNAKVGFTDYATKNRAGVIKASASYGSDVSSTGAFYPVTKTYSAYTSAYDQLFICKATLENVLSARFVTLTQTQYDALVSGGTVDSNTYYFIEEE